MAETNAQNNTLSYAAVAANNKPIREATLSQEELPPYDARNYRLQTVVLDRPYTATFGCRDGQIDIIVKYFEQIKVLPDIKCINSITPVLRIDNQQNFKIMKILILLKSFISLFYIIRYILRSMM